MTLNLGDAPTWPAGSGALLHLSATIYLSTWHVRTEGSSFHPSSSKCGRGRVAAEIESGIGAGLGYICRAVSEGGGED